MRDNSFDIRLVSLSILTLTFFALNSIFCRLALLNNLIDAYSFTTIRIISGAFTLLAIVILKNKKSFTLELKSNWLGGFFLFLYAIFFSFSYINIDAGLGALILFGTVQITMIIYSIIKKEKLTKLKLLGVIIAFAGLVYLLLPSKNFDLSILSALLMIISGIAWGFYTLSAKNVNDKISQTTTNFLKASLLCILILPFFISNLNVSFYGLTFAIISGSITSALGYFLWFFVASKIQTVTAGIIQLIVPIIAIFLGVVFLGESVSQKLVISTLIILIGIFLGVYKRSAKS